MLDLKTIFDPDRRTSMAGALCGITPLDLSADWHFRWDERAAIMEYDGGVPREQAEALALAEVVRAMQQAGDQQLDTGAYGRGHAHTTAGVASPLVDRLS